MAYIAPIKVESEKPLRLLGTYAPASLAANTQRVDTVSVPGVRYQDSDGNGIDFVHSVNPPATIPAGFMVQRMVVSANDTVQITVYNPTAGAVAPASGTWEFFIERF